MVKAIRGEPVEVMFDRPRQPVWRRADDGGILGGEPPDKAE